MTPEHYVALAVSAIGTVGVVIAAVLPGQLRSLRETKANRRENREDHSRVVASVESLAGSVEVLGDQVQTLTTLVIETASDLKAHTKWEESQKYATVEHVEQIVAVIGQTEGNV